MTSLIILCVIVSDRCRLKVAQIAIVDSAENFECCGVCIYEWALYCEYSGLYFIYRYKQVNADKIVLDFRHRIIAYQVIIECVGFHCSYTWDHLT